jgi:hypothetical protein
MSIVTDTKEIVSIIQKLGNMELYQKILDLQSEILEITEENNSLKRELTQAKEQLEIKEKMIFKKPFWYMDGDNTPFCPHCWENERKTIHLIGPTVTSFGPNYDCPHCKQNYTPEYRGSYGGEVSSYGDYDPLA